MPRDAVKILRFCGDCFFLTLFFLLSTVRHVDFVGGEREQGQGGKGEKIPGEVLYEQPTAVHIMHPCIENEQRWCEHASILKDCMTGQEKEAKREEAKRRKEEKAKKASAQHGFWTKGTWKTITIIMVSIVMVISLGSVGIGGYWIDSVAGAEQQFNKVIGPVYHTL